MGVRCDIIGQSMENEQGVFVNRALWSYKMQKGLIVAKLKNLNLRLQK